MSTTIISRHSRCRLRMTSPRYSIEMLESRCLLSVSDVDVFNLSSKPDSNFTVFLDFDGYDEAIGPWGEDLDLPSFDTDGDNSSFNPSELDRIYRAWQYVAEDFAPFDLNVTTREPAVDRLIRSGPTDTTWGVRAVISHQSYSDLGVGGAAFLNTFDAADDIPVMVHLTGAASMGDTISHEVGHALGLRHDGFTPNAYYDGHESGDGRWAPIMGNPYASSVTQWSVGDYFDANNQEDDLAIITDNGFGYRADDYGDDLSAAVPLDVANATEVSAYGIIEQNTDRDFLSFQTGAGQISLDIGTLADRPNLNVFAALYDSSGDVVTWSNPGDRTGATISTAVSAGTYYLRVEGVGSHDVFDPVTDDLIAPAAAPWQSHPPTGFSDYGSLGQYFVGGQVVAPSNNRIEITALDTDKLEGGSGVEAHTFLVERFGNISAPASVEYVVTPTKPAAVGAPYVSAPDADDFATGTAFGGVVDFAANESSKTIQLEATGDATLELDESFRVGLLNASAGWTISKTFAEGSILSDESLFGLSSIGSATSSIHHQMNEGPYTQTMIRWRQITTSALDHWAIDNISLSNGQLAEDFDPIDESNWSLRDFTTLNTQFGGDGVSLVTTFGVPPIAQTRFLDVAPGDMLTFDIIFGDGTNGGGDVLAGDDVALEFSTDGGNTWQELALLDSEEHVEWTTHTFEFPQNADDSPAAEMTFWVSREGGTSLPATIDWTVDTTGLADAADRFDFVGADLPNGQVEFAAGQRLASFVVPIDQDFEVEPDEMFNVRLLDVSGEGLLALDPVALERLGIIADEDAIEPINGDLNSDGVYDCQDIDTLVEAIARDNDAAVYDVNRDGQVDLADRDAWLAEAGAANLGPGRAYLLGDANLDGLVDGLDHIAWNENKFTALAAWCGGDFTANGFVDALDFVEWNENKFTSSDVHGTAYDLSIPSQPEHVAPRFGNGFDAQTSVHCMCTKLDITDVSVLRTEPQYLPTLAANGDFHFIYIGLATGSFYGPSPSIQIVHLAVNENGWPYDHLMDQPDPNRAANGKTLLGNLC